MQDPPLGRDSFLLLQLWKSGAVYRVCDLGGALVAWGKEYKGCLEWYNRHDIKYFEEHIEDYRELELGKWVDN